MKATLLTTAILSLFLTSCVGSMVTANNNSSAEAAIPAKANIEKMEVSLTEVPTIVLAAVKKAYPNEYIKQTTRFAAEDMVYYQFQLQNRHKRPISVVFNEKAKEEAGMRNVR